jgi:hypothetical protein
MDEGFVLSHVVGCLEVKADRILEAVPFGRDEDDPAPAPTAMSKPSKYIV